MTLPAGPAARHRAVAAHLTALAAGADDLDVPAPVPGWTGRDVVDHLLTWLPGLLSAVGVTLDQGRTGDLVADWRVHAERVQALLDDPASAERVVEHQHVPRMTLTEMVDRLYTTDVFLHSWDLARATGQDDRLDPEHCAELLAGMQPLDDLLRSSGQYGPQVAVPDDATAQDRLLGFIGRDPAWSPS